MRFIIACLIFASLGWGQTRCQANSRFNNFSRILYVDSVAGDDANDGLRGRPLQTIAELVTKDTACPVNRWFLKKDSAWKEQLNTPRSFMTVRAYGTGTARPILDASDAIATEAWAKTDGKTNVYEASVTLDVAGGFVNVWQDGVFMTRAADLAACDATAGTYFPASENEGANTLYVHATGDGNPASNGKAYEYSRRAHGIRSYPINNKFYGLETRRNLDLTGSMFLGTGGYMQNCVFRDGNKHNVLVQDGTTVEDSEAINANYNTAASLWVYYVTTATAGMGHTCTRCVASLPTAKSYVTGFFGHAGSGTWGTVTFTGCSTTNTGTGFGGGQVTQMNIVNGTVTTANAAFSTSSPTLISGGAVSCGADCNSGIYLNSNAVTVRGLTLTGGNKGGSGAVVNAWESNTAIDIQDSVISGFISGLQLYSVNAAASVTSLRNTWTIASQYYVFGATPTSLSSDYNTFTAPGVGTRFTLDGEKTYTQWKALGYDANSTP